MTMMRLGCIAVSLVACTARATTPEADPTTGPDIASMYEVSTAGTTTKMKAGEKGKVVISIAAKNGAHVSDEAPLRIELSSKESKLDQEKITLADSLNKKAKDAKDYPNPRFEVGFTPSTQGKTSVDARMTFFICTESLCSRQTKKLSLPVEVN
jgi:hypothetical protein